MKIILDEGVPEPLADDPPGHQVSTVRQPGLKGIKNGDLLALVESLGADAFVTGDKSMETQQQLHRRAFAVVILSTNFWPVMRSHTAAIAEAIDNVDRGSVANVFCGTFVPRRFRLDHRLFRDCRGQRRARRGNRRARCPRASQKGGTPPAKYT